MTLAARSSILCAAAALAVATLAPGSAAQTVPTAPPSDQTVAVEPVAAPPAAPAPIQVDAQTDRAPANPTDLAALAQVECIAKVILHEGANQPEAGRIAIAQVIRTRLRARRFGADACAVIGQRGQFFDVARYNPARGAAWAKAVAIAARTLAGEGEELVEGALFFHTATSPMPGHVRVAQIADHVFYR